MRLVLLLILVLVTQSVAQTVTICRVTQKGNGVSKAHMTQLLRKVEKIAGIKLLAGSDVELPASLFDETRKQYDGGALAQLVAGRNPAGPCVGLAEVDLFMKTKPDWRYCFSAYAGQGAVFSDFRMRAENYGQRSDPALTQERLEKLVLSWVGRKVLNKPASTDCSSLLFQPILGPDDLDRMQLKY